MYWNIFLATEPLSNCDLIKMLWVKNRWPQGQPKAFLSGVWCQEAVYLALGQCPGREQRSQCLVWSTCLLRNYWINTCMVSLSLHCGCNHTRGDAEAQKSQPRKPNLHCNYPHPEKGGDGEGQVAQRKEPWTQVGNPSYCPAMLEPPDDLEWWQGYTGPHCGLGLSFTIYLMGRNVYLFPHVVTVVRIKWVVINMGGPWQYNEVRCV